MFSGDLLVRLGSLAREGVLLREMTEPPSNQEEAKNESVDCERHEAAASDVAQKIVNTQPAAYP